MSPAQCGAPELPRVIAARGMLGRPSADSNDAAGSPLHTIGANADEPVYPERMNVNQSPSSPSNAARAYSTGYRLWSSSPVMPLAATASAGTYSPKSYIQPA